jgi:hypothetical protein
MQFYGSPSEQAGRLRPRGFVLVSVLLIVALATILVVVASMMAQIERKAAANGAKIEQARANALFALDLAVNQLQREAGPDQRVTARAEILDTNSTVLRTNAVNQPLWTGVWKTGTNQLDVGTSPQRTASLGSLNPTIAEKVAKATWLVSGTNSTYDPVTFAGVTTGTNADAAVLAKNLGTNAISVAAPLVPVVVNSGNTTTTNGAYAYWVADEGVKAKVNLTDPTYGISPAADFAANQRRFLTSQSVPVNTGLLGGNNTADVRDQADLGKVNSLQSLGFVTGMNAASLAGTNAATYSPDATVHSWGVLADVRNGGLKWDLSATFEDVAQYRAFLIAKRSTDPAREDATGDAKLFAVAGNAMNAGNNVLQYVFGPRWQQFYNYYTLYKDTTPANGLNNAAFTFNGLNSFSGGNPGTSTPTIDMRVYKYSSIMSNSGSARNVNGDYYLPRFMGIGIYLSLSSEVVPPPAGQPAPGPGQKYYKLRLYAEPRVVYYNPYNVTLNSPTDGTNSKVQLAWGSALFASLTANVTVGSTVVLDNKKMFGGTGGKANLSWSTDPNPANCNLTFTPGQIRVFGLSTLTPVADRTIQTFGGQNIPGGTKNSFLTSDVGQSQWTYLPNNKDAGGNGTGVSPTDDWVGLVNESDVVTIKYSGGLTNRIRSNNGRNTASLGSPALTWPVLNGGTSHTLGRFFFDDATSQSTQSVNLGSISAIQSTTQGTSFCYFVARAKGIRQSRTAAASTTATGNMPVFSSCDGNISPYPINHDSPSMDADFELAAQNPTSATEIQVTGSSPTLTTFWGVNGVARNSSDCNGFVMADIPRQPLLSLGQFMHMMMRNSMASVNDVAGDPDVDQSSALMPVGGSLCNPFIPLDKAYNSIPNQFAGSLGTFVMDDNFLTNEALFDTYFFSSVPPASPDAAYRAVFPALTTGSGTGVFNDANIRAGTVNLPNARMRMYAKDGVAPAAAALQKNSTAAANLLVDGAFNVNSTSVAAWAALLSSTGGNALSYLSNGAFSSINLNGKIPILRCPSVVSTDGTNPVNTPFGGVHALTNDQITSLSTEIVKQVKARGPFLSLADFINRRLDPTTGLGFKGALQAAIDATDINTTNLSGISSLWMTTGDVVNGMNTKGPVAGGKFYPGQAPGNTAIGIPGWLMQQDLVQAFSPVMTPRSDTFVIRTYGEVKNPKNGAVEAQAWGEAVVQRLPDFVDQADTNLAALGDATPPASVNPTNKSLGRRFQVVSFRWLNENEI